MGYGITLSTEATEVNGVMLVRSVQQITGARKITVDRFTCPGMDASPLPGDYTLIVPVQRSGGGASAAYLDPVNEPMAEPGEVRHYARNTDGEIVSEIWQRGDGKIDITNEKTTLRIGEDGSFTFENENATVTVGSDGTINLRNGGAEFDIPTDGNITSSVAIKAPDFITEDGISLNDHKHGSVKKGSDTSGGPE